jgi:ABC-type long-subunit fatty acid transport system fused permease/ATPase subunit
MKSVFCDYISCFITVSPFYKCISYSVILFLSVTISVLTLYLTSSISYRYLPCMDLMNA